MTIRKVLGSSTRVLVAAAFLLTLSAFVIALGAQAGQAAPKGQPLPESQWGAYVGVAKCTSCHEPQAKGYHAGPHSTAWMRARRARPKAAKVAMGRGNRTSPTSAPRDGCGASSK